jgi:hypothetical protein
MTRKIRRVADRIVTQGYRDQSGRHFWFVLPEGMDLAEAFQTQEHHGPFVKRRAARRSWRRRCLSTAPMKMRYEMCAPTDRW